MRNSAIVSMTKEEKKERKDLERIYKIFILGSTILGMGIGYLIKERSNVILYITSNEIKNALQQFQYKNLKFPKSISLDTAVNILQTRIETSEVRQPVSSVLAEKAIKRVIGPEIKYTKISTLVDSYKLISLFLAHQSWSGKIASRSGKYTPLVGAVTGFIMGYLCIRLIHIATEQRIQKLKNSNEILKQEINELILQKAKEEETVCIMPLEDTPDEYICPITGMIIRDPVLIGDRHAYERAAITYWYNKSTNKKCPLNPGLALANPEWLSTDTVLQSKIKEYVEVNKLKRDGRESLSKLSLPDSKKEVQKGELLSGNFSAAFFNSSRNAAIILCGLTVTGSLAKIWYRR